VAALVARNANEVMVGSGGVCVWRESGARWSVLCLYVWQESGFSRREDVFTFNLPFFFLFQKFNEFCTFNAICKDNAAINCVSVEHKKVHSRQL
jgi:hypothetical protein